ncbi:hypothetical protein UA08_01360 [Talaromyces atroroseus]|uniref:Uncharacterized protein n=1 Tax=Talaromyces atroroseus TaxID=1441469 RepID=A0A1Q5Q9V9_TALAT|nr:hypothetical protein UA08_01360 [Talaromyces atroroseus]OKL62716.1 hypothetical protein UA08_01360 [Talaromyces atroroseus]
MELSPSTQTATLTYLKRDVQFSSQQGLRPYRLIGVRPTSEVPATNMQFEQYQMPITDLRRFDQSSFRDSGWASTSHTDDESPGLVSNHMPQNEDRGDGTISMTANHDQVKEYCRQMSNRLQEELGAEKTFLYEFRFRSNSLPSGHGTLDSKQAYSPELSVAERFPGNPAQVYLEKFQHNLSRLAASTLYT